jgi:hypothetical protein
MIKKTAIPTLPLLSTLAVLLTLMVSSGAAREVRAIYLAGPGQALSKAHIVGENVDLELDLPQRNLSPPVDIPRGDLQLVALPEPLPAGAEIPAGAPKILIPASWQRCILIFLGDPRNSVFPARIIPVNGAGENFPLGSTLVYNVSNYTIGGKFGSQRLVVKPGQTELFGEPIPEFGSYRVAIDFIAEKDTEPTALFRSKWQHYPEARQILFVVPQIGQERPRIWGVLDRGGSATSEP